MILAPHQADLVSLPLDRRVFLEGIAGTGKTTAAVARLLRLLAEGVPAGSVLVIVPQRTVGAAYADALRKPATPAGGEVTVLTVGGLAQRMAELFWPLVAEPAGFAEPNRPPTFLTLETAQYYMARLVGPLLDAGYFDSISIERNRLYSQLLDNLNKATVVGLSIDEIAGRLKGAWLGESAQARVYDEAQECANRFRAYCLAHNLLDFSLQYEVFVRHLWPIPACR
ncbi:MAG: DEAD/DEAH box helicase family protein, partial [Chloroflexi bacterium]|nr:DEAD/DEAH box helicase family protein [Chloroflexota bacterium]